MRRGRLALDPQLLQERLEFAFELSSTVGADGADLDACGGDDACRGDDACGGDVFRDEFAKLFRSVAFMLEEANELKAGEVVHAQHRVPVAAERSRIKGPGMSIKNRSARSLVRLSVDFGTAKRRTLDSEHCTHGLHVPVIGTPDMRAISVLGWPRSLWNSMI